MIGIQSDSFLKNKFIEFTTLKTLVIDLTPNAPH